MSKKFSSIQEVLELAFSILYDPDETLNFIAPNKYEVRSTVVNMCHRISQVGRDQHILSPTPSSPQDHPKIKPYF